MLFSQAPDLEIEYSARSALAQAVATKDVSRVRLVLSKFAGPPAPEGHRQPLLAYYAAVNDLAMGRLLLDAGADPNTPVEGPLDPDFLENVQPTFLRNYLADRTEGEQFAAWARRADDGRLA